MPPSRESEPSKSGQTAGDASNPGSDSKLTRSISIATIIMMGSVFLSRIMGLVREQVIVHYGGTSFEVDAYVTSFLIPELLNHFLAGGFLSVTFIPIFQRYQTRNDTDGAWRSFSNLFTIGSVLFVVLIPIAILFTPEFLSPLGSMKGKSVESADLTVRLTRIILPAQIFFYWGSFFSAVQMANHKFFLPALSPLCYNLGIILGGIVLGPSLGIEGFAWGVLIGAFFGNVVLQVPGALRVGMKYRPVFNVRDPEFVKYVALTIPMVLGLGMTFSNEVFFRFFGSYLGEGGTSSVNYALRTMMIVVAIFGQASGVAFFPYLSRYAVEGAFDKMAELLNSVLKRIALYLVPLSAIMVVLAQQIISLLFERGSFTQLSTQRTSSVLIIYLFGTFFLSASMILVRVFYAMQNTILPMIVTTATSILVIPLYIVLSKNFGADGMAGAAVCGMILQFVVLYLIWISRQKLWSSARQFTVNMLKIIVASSVGAFGGAMVKSFIPSLHLGNFKYNLLISFTVFAVAITIVFVIYEIAGVQRFRQSIRGLLKR